MHGMFWIGPRYRGDLFYRASFAELNLILCRRPWITPTLRFQVNIFILEIDRIASEISSESENSMLKRYDHFPLMV